MLHRVHIFASLSFSEVLVKRGCSAEMLKTAANEILIKVRGTDKICNLLFSLLIRRLKMKENIFFLEINAPMIS